MIWLAHSGTAVDYYPGPRRLVSSSRDSSGRQTIVPPLTLPLSAIVTFIPIASASRYSSKSKSASFSEAAGRDTDGLSTAGVRARASACHTDRPFSTM